MRANFEPEPDITTYELAYIVSRLSFISGPPRRGVLFTEEQWADLPPNIRRHFIVTEG